MKGSLEKISYHKVTFNCRASILQNLLLIPFTYTCMATKPNVFNCINIAKLSLISVNMENEPINIFELPA